MNELLFVSHTLIVILFVLVALRLGREALCSLLILQMVFANLFVTKQIDCWGLHVTCSDVYTVGSVFALNCLREFFGKGCALNAIYLGAVLSLFFVIMSKLHLLYIPNVYDTNGEAFASILTSTGRIVIVSLVVTFIAQRCDLLLFGILKSGCPYLPLALRSSISLLVTQLLDTLLFTYLGLYGLVHSVWEVAGMSYMVKVMVILCSVPMLLLSKRVVPSR